MEVSMEAARGSGAKHIILVHGACHGGWSWYKVASRLPSAAAGLSYHVAAPDLAASGIDGRRLSEVPTFRDYSGPLLDVLRSLPEGEKAVLVGHSLGGLSVALAAELFPEKVAVAVFLAAFMPDCVSPPSDVVLKVNSWIYGGNPLQIFKQACTRQANPQQSHLPYPSCRMVIAAIIPRWTTR
jgi:pimeloyl-ACP methyl ester carboxylesterase